MPEVMLTELIGAVDDKTFDCKLYADEPLSAALAKFSGVVDALVGYFRKTEDIRALYTAVEVAKIRFLFEERHSSWREEHDMPTETSPEMATSRYIDSLRLLEEELLRLLEAEATQMVWWNPRKRGLLRTIAEIRRITSL